MINSVRFCSLRYLSKFSLQQQFGGVSAPVKNRAKVFFRVVNAECCPVKILEADGRPAGCYVVPGKTAEEEAERKRVNVANKLGVPVDEVEVVKNYLLVQPKTGEEDEIDSDMPVVDGDTYVFHYFWKKAMDETWDEKGGEDEEQDFNDKNVVSNFVWSQRQQK